MCACVCSNVVLHWKSTFLTKNAENLQKGLPYLAKEENASRLMEGVGKIPVLSQMALSKTTRVPLKEGWALRKVKIVCRFYEKQKT